MQQPSAQGIAALFRGNPQPLQQRIQQEQQTKPGLPPDLQKLLALNIVTNEQDAVAKQQAMDQLAQMQGGPQGQMPTVMQSVQEQARQKMEAQQVQAQQQEQQQQQGIQALMQQTGPAPVPPETPQPQAQPQGIDELPVEFQMAGGGIVAFQEGKRVPRIQDEETISDEERARLERELLMRVIGEEVRNPPERKTPMQITEADLTSIPGMEQSDLMARALRDAAGPQPDNRALLNRIERKEPRALYTGPQSESLNERAARQMEEKGSIYDKDFGIPPAERAAKEAKRQEAIAQIPSGGPTVTGGERIDSSETERNIRNLLSALPGAGAAKATTVGRQALAGLAALLGSDKSNVQEVRDEPQNAPSRTAAATAAPISRPTSQMTPQQMEAAMRSTPTEKPVADLKALAEQQQRQQAPRPARPARPAMAAPVASAAPSPEVQAAQVPAQESLQRQLLLKALSSDPEAARIAEQELRKREVGTPDTTQYDKLIEEMEKRKAQLEGPKDQWGQLMEYLGQISATPRGLSSFEAGAAGVRGVKALEQTRQLEQYNLTKQAADVAQKKLDTVRAFAEKQYDVGKSVFDKEYERQFDAAKQLELSDKEAARLAQENTLKRLEIASAEKRNEASVAAQRYSADRGQAKTDAEEARNKQYQDLMAQSRRLTAAGDKAGAAEAAARAADIAAISGRVSAASGLAGPKAMTRDQAEDNVRKDLEDFRVGPKLINDATSALKASGIANPTTLQIKEYLVQQNMKGVDLGATSAPTSLPSGVTVKRVGP